MSTSPRPRSPKPVPFPSSSLGPLDKGGHAVLTEPLHSHRPQTALGMAAEAAANRNQGHARIPAVPEKEAASRRDPSPAPVPGARGTASPHLTSNTSSSRIRVPNTIMPLTSIMGWSLRARCLVVFFLQSRIKVTFFLWILRAILCHLRRNSPGR